MEKLKYKIQDITGVRNTIPGRQKHILKRKYKGMQVARSAIGHINPKTGEIEYNELLEHPTIKKIRNDKF